MAKRDVPETLQDASRNGIQIMGGFGMLPEADMERHFRESMQATVGGGASQIMRTIIAQSMKLWRQGRPTPAARNQSQGGTHGRFSKVRRIP